MLTIHRAGRRLIFNIRYGYATEGSDVSYRGSYPVWSIYEGLEDPSDALSIERLVWLRYATLY